MASANPTHEEAWQTFLAARGDVRRKLDEKKLTCVLPSNVIPEKYDVDLSVDVKGGQYTGTETVYLLLESPVKEIKLNSLNLEIDSKATLSTKDGRKLNVTSVQTDDTAEVVTFSFDEEVPAGGVELSFKFTGKIQRALFGFYIAKYTSADGVEHTGAATHFEPVTCRSAIPCVDEPAARAIFNISITADAKYTVLSNAPEESAMPSKDMSRVKHTFAPTFPLPTYLLAWVIMEMEYVETKTKAGVPIRVFAGLGKKDRAQAALETAAWGLDWLANYFDIPFPLPKLDLVAVPEFPIGGMENWGLITFRESRLLFGPGDPLNDYKFVVRIILHELSHMWFGDLVTLVWWDDLWLKEGFADWICFRAQDDLKPGWATWQQFASAQTMNALELDQWKATHPVQVHVAHPSECTKIFDAISYQKGSSLVKMIFDFIGEDAFRKGAKAYLTKYQYACATTQDLWDELGAACDVPVARVMGAWCANEGYPYVRATPTEDGGVKLTQRRYIASNPAHTVDTHWPIPVKAFGDELTSASTLMEGHTLDLTPTLSGWNKGSWVKLNAGAATLYRVHYEGVLFDKLKQQAKSLPAVDRLGLIDDAFSLAQGNVVATRAALELLLQYEGETEYFVLNTIAYQLNKLTHTFPELELQIDNLRGRIFGASFQRLGWETRNEDSDFDKLLRPLAIKQMALAGDDGIVWKCKQAFDQFVQGNANAVTGDMLPVVFNVAVREGARPEFEAGFGVYNNPKFSAAVREAALAALTHSPDHACIDELLQNTLNPDKIILQDGKLVLIVCGANNALARERIQWKFIKANWDRINEHWGRATAIEHLLRGALTGLYTSDDADELSEFFASHPHTPGVASVVKNIEESVRTRSLQRGQNLKEVESWFTALLSAD